MTCFSVYADGGICLDILQNRWSPTYDVAAILTSIQVCFLTARHCLEIIIVIHVIVQSMFSQGHS